MSENNTALTYDDLARFTEEVLFPGIEHMINDVRTELKGDIADLRTELKGDIADLRTELKGEMADMRSEFRGEFRAVRGDLDDLRERVSRLEKMAKEDLSMMAGEIASIKKEIKRLQMRVNALES
ncbi:MAG: hypothetical protein WCO55_03625 [Candidatus Falkowbacteria bacterium]